MPEPDAKGRGPPAGTLSALLLSLAQESSPSADAPVPAPGDRVGRFEVVRELGRGGFGVVLEAKDTVLHRRVALKLVRADRRDEAGTLGLAEAEAIANLSHPNIVQLHDLGTSDAGPYLVFELLEGEPLSRRLERGPLPAAEAARLALEVAKGLAYAHRSGVVHRDLKPSNVFLCSDGRVRVLDFGLALVLGRRPAVAGGTPGWMAPEQRRGAPEDARTDVWALGAMLYRTLAGRDPASAKLSIPDAPELVTQVGRMLEDDPVERPRDGAAVEQALEPIVHALEATDRPVTVRARRRIPRRLLWAMALLPVLLATGLVAWRVLRPPTPVAPPGPPLVVVADFANETGDPDLDALGSLVATALQESPGLRVLTRSRMYDVLRELAMGAAERFDESLGRSIARRVGAQALLVGSVRRLHEFIVVEWRAIDPERDESRFSGREQALGTAQVLALVDRVAARTRHQLVGEPKQADSVPVAQIATSNLEAYRYYVKGRSLQDRGLPGGEEAYKKAIELDPDFALAHYALLASSMDAPIDELRPIAAAAMRAADRAPWREARLIRAMNATVERRLEDARALYREVLDRDPDDKEVLSLYAFLAPSPEEGIVYAERALKVDPTYVPAQWQMLEFLPDLRRHAELIPLARTWLTLPPEVGRLEAAAQALALARDLDGALEAARRADLLSQNGTEVRAIQIARGEYRDAEQTIREFIGRTGRGYGMLADVLSFQGRRREALAILDEPARAPFTRYPALVILAGHGPSERLRAVAREFATSRPAGAWLTPLALAAAGDVAEAERYLQDLKRELADPGPGVAPDEAANVRSYVQARVAYARGDRAKGRAMLRDLVAMPRLSARVVTAFTLGEVCSAEGDLTCAVAALRQYRLEYTPGLAFQSWMYPRSAVLLADALERLGQAREARGLVERFLSDWSQADADLPELARARAVCGRLKCRPGAERSTEGTR